MVGVLLIVFVGVGCGSSGGRGNIDGHKGGRVAGATTEETTAPEGDRSAAKTKQEPAGLDVKVVSPDHAYQPVGFGEGSLWVTDIPTCNDSAPPSSSASGVASGSSYSSSSVDGSAPLSLVACAAPANMLLRRLDPQSGEAVAPIPLEGFFANVPEATFGAGSVWVSSTDIYPGPAGGKQPNDVVLRIDPHTNRVVDRIPVYSSSGLAFGHGSVWVTSASYGTVSRIDPQTDKVVAKIEVGRGAVDIAVDESSGAVWVASSYLPKDYGAHDIPKYSEDNNLTRLDPETNRVVKEIPIEAHAKYGGAYNVAVGEEAVWVLSSRGKLYKVNPATNEVVGTVDLGNSPSGLAVYEGGVWAMVAVKEFRLVQVDPRTMHIVASEDIGPINGPGGLAAGAGYVWGSSGHGLARVAP